MSSTGKIDYYTFIDMVFCTRFAQSAFHHGIWRLIYLLALTTASQSFALDLSTMPDSFELREDADYFIEKSIDNDIDKTSKLKANEITSALAQKPFTGSLNLGFSRSTVWIRFEINDRFSKDWHLIVKTPTLHSVRLHKQKPDGTELVSHQGYLQNHPSTEQDNIWLVFHLPMDASNNTFLLEVKSNNALYIPVAIANDQGLAKINQQQYFIWGTLFGFILVMSLYNLFLFFSLSDKVYFYYVCFLGANGYGLFLLNGLSNQWLSPDSASFNHYSMPLAVGTAILFGILFVKAYLNIGHFNKILDKFLSLIAVGALGIPLFAFILGRELPIVAIVYTGLAVSIVSVIGLYCLQQGLRAAKYFLLAWVTFFIGTSIFSLALFNLIPANTLTIHLKEVGFGAAMILFSLGLADRFNTERNEKQTLNSFLATISHEVRTLCQNLAFAFTKLGQNPSKLETEAIASNLAKTYQEMEYILANMIDISKIKSDQYTPTYASTDLNSLIRDVIILCEPFAERKNIFLEFLEPDHNQILIDTYATKRILINLVVNAVHYSNQGTVELSYSIHQKADQHNLQLTIDDNGPGISEEALQQLIRPYTRGQATHPSDTAGSGLGLSIISSFLTKLDGSLQVKPRPSGGSSFIVTMPLTNTVSQPDSPIKDHSSADQTVSTSTIQVHSREKSTDLNKQSTLNIVIIDDEPDIRASIEGYLAPFCDVSLKQIASGNDFLDLVNSPSFNINSIDIIFMDCHMTGLSGVETIKNLSNSELLAQIPFIAMSAFAYQDDIRDLLDSGFKDTLSKPFLANHFVEKIAQWTGVILTKEDMFTPKAPDFEFLFTKISSANNAIYEIQLQEFIRTTIYYSDDIASLLIDNTQRELVKLLHDLGKHLRKLRLFELSDYFSSCEHQLQSSGSISQQSTNLTKLGPVIGHYCRLAEDQLQHLKLTIEQDTEQKG